MAEQGACLDQHRLVHHLPLEAEGPVAPRGGLGGGVQQAAGAGAVGLGRPEVFVGEGHLRRVDAQLAAVSQGAALLGVGREVHTSHEKLAQRLGASRETVSRALKVFEGGGLLRLRRGTIEILQPQALRAAAEGRAASVTAVTDGRRPRP